MANNHDASFPEYWSRRMQRYLQKTQVFRAVVSFEESATLKRGDKVNRPFSSDIIVRDHTRGGTVTIDDNTDTQESLTVDQEKVSGFYIDDFDELQTNYSTGGHYAEKAAIKVGETVDGAFFAEVENATSSVDDSDFGGTAGDGVTLTVANVDRMLSKAKKKLDRLSVPQTERKAVLSPDFLEILSDAISDKDTNLGDEVGKNGLVGHRKGFALHMSNSLLSTYVLSLVTLPTEADTIVINGVTFTWKDTLGSTAGNIHIPSTVDIARANLAAAIAAPTTSVVSATEAGFVGHAAGSDEEKALLDMTATNDNTADTLTLKVEGRGFIAVSETLTDATDAWTPALQIQHNLAMRKGAIEGVIQKNPRPKFKEVSDKLGRNVLTPVLYGKKTFTEGAREMCDMKVRVDSWS